MKPIPILILTGTLLCCSLKSLPQATNNFQDSAYLHSEEEVAAPLEEKVEEVVVTNNEATSYYDNYAPDTMLVSNRHFLSADSFMLLQNDKQFGYAKNLDSLLKSIKTDAEKRKKELNERADSARHLKSSPSRIESLLKSKSLQYALWGLAAAFVLFVIYKLVFAEGGFRRASNSVGNVQLLDEENPVPAPGRNFDTLIAKAKGENNFRLAVRYLYLQLLQKLSAAGAISFAVDKTNAEYVRELSDKPFKSDIQELTRYYDYVWYGEFEMNADQYERIESRFKSLVL